MALLWVAFWIGCGLYAGFGLGAAWQAARSARKLRRRVDRYI